MELVKPISFRALGFYERLGFERLSGSRYQMTAEAAQQFGSAQYVMIEG